MESTTTPHGGIPTSCWRRNSGSRRAFDSKIARAAPEHECAYDVFLQTNNKEGRHAQSVPRLHNGRSGVRNVCRCTIGARRSAYGYAPAPPYGSAYGYTPGSLDSQGIFHPWPGGSLPQYQGGSKQPW